MQRDKLLKNLETDKVWDIVIIGGGATGLGAALDASNRGYKTLLIEQSDFGKGTSSKSTKLIHGGVRYLEQGNLRLVKEALEERGHLLKNAASCTSTVDLILPVYSISRLIYYYLGLKIYELLSGKLAIGKTRILSKTSVVKHFPNIKTDGLIGGVLYQDGQFNDSKLCIRIARTAVQEGATILNYTRCTGFGYENGKINTIRFTDDINKKDYEVHTKTVINASGAFADTILKMDNSDHQNLVSPSLGIHLVVDKNIGIGHFGLLIPKTTDGRVLFAIPWMNKVIIGTTDTTLNKISYDPVIPKDDVEFIIKNINQYLQFPVSEKDVKSVFAGIRPLVKGAKNDKTSSLPRDHTIIISESGLISIIGGKWTTYRKMAEDVVDTAAKRGRLKSVSCKTRSLRIDSQYDDLEIVKTDEFNKKIHPEYPYTWYDVKYACMNEMAMTPDDVLSRRLRLLFQDSAAAIACSDEVAMFMQKEMNHSDEWRKTQNQDFLKTAYKYLINT
ncbi:MAG: glycerol-3-phosphate dehydrogenase/oxidase [Saprospiraceae bacterium]|nr:glycerol-3-phosphate dehydrogenase/oxidase [Saprospiraceae bacterium]